MHCKGVGARKLKYRLRQRFEGISEQRVQRVLSGSKLNQMVNAKFRNRAIGRPIRNEAFSLLNRNPYVFFRSAIKWTL